MLLPPQIQASLCTNPAEVELLAHEKLGNALPNWTKPTKCWRKKACYLIRGTEY